MWMCGDYDQPKTFLIFVKKIKKGVNILNYISDIKDETLKYMDVNRQGRNYKEVDKN